MTRFISFCLLALICACKQPSNTKEHNTEKSLPVKEETQTAWPALTENYVEFYLNGDETIIKKQAMARWEELNGKPYFTITNNGLASPECKNSIVLEIDGDKTGSYPFETGRKVNNTRAHYWPDCEQSDNAFEMISGSISIISNDGNLLNATFEGAAKNNKTGQLFSISKGKVVNAKIQKVTNLPN